MPLFPYDSTKPTGVGNWPAGWELTHLSAENTVKYEDLRTFMDHVQLTNRIIPGFEGDAIRGEDRWALVLVAYEIGHPGEISSAHSLRSKWSRAKTAMKSLIALNGQIAAGQAPAQYP